MEGLPKDIHRLIIHKYLNVRDIALLSATCKYFRNLYQDYWKKEDDDAMREHLEDIKRRNLTVIEKRRRKAKDRKGNPLPLDHWDICRGCESIYAAKNIEKHKCTNITRNPCRHCGLYCCKYSCPFEVIKCNIIHEGCKTTCTYREERHRVHKHWKSLSSKQQIAMSDLLSTTYNFLRIMSGLGGLQYEN